MTFTLCLHKLRFKKQDQLCAIVNVPLAYVIDGTAISFLEHKALAKCAALPSTLFILEGEYSFYDHAYELRQPGLYRFMYPEKSNAQRIIYKDNIINLMSCLAWMITHGEADDHLDDVALINKAKHEKLYLTCERAVRFAATLLQDVGIQSRIIGARTLDQWNTYDNGHYLIEVYHQDLKKWVLYDLDCDTYFLSHNQPLSLIEFSSQALTDYQIAYLSNDIRVKVDEKKYNYDFLNEARIADLKKWYTRILQFTYIEHEGGYYSKTEHDPSITKYLKYTLPSITYLNEERFLQRFYP